MLNTPVPNAHLQQFMEAQIPHLALMFPFVLTPSVKLRDFVGLVLVERVVEGVRRGRMISIVPRSDLALYISTKEAQTIPAGRSDALPIFVSDQGAHHAFLLPIPDDLRRTLGRRGPSSAVT